MHKLFFTFVLTLLVGSAFSQESLFKASDIDIPYTKYTLDNGLTLLVHEDHKAPIVAVNIWYHVGAKNEKEGKTGFAHLFEHLMFNGSENYDHDYFEVMDHIGATDLNGTTNSDRTNYFQNVPLSGLDQVLFLESDRMGHLLGAIDQEVLDEQRGVVQNEKRQNENKQYGRQYGLITEAMYPKGHPYSWTVIGSMDDLNAASLEDVHEWFKQYYGPNNAVICLAGDITPEEALEKVNLYFGDIPPGPSLARHNVNIPEKFNNTRQSYEDQVAESRITITWHTAQKGTKDDALLELASMILSDGKSSRLYKDLVYDKQWASNVSAYQSAREISGNFGVQSNIKQGSSLEDVEKRIHELLEDFIKNGPTKDELNMAKASYFAGMLKGLERIGGFGGKSDILCRYQTFMGNADHYKISLKYIEDATIEEVREAAERYLRKGHHTLICSPFENRTASEKGADRSALPELGAPADPKFPDTESFVLDNGMNVQFIRRIGVPTVNMSMVVDAGTVTDHGTHKGLMNLTTGLLITGTSTKNTFEIDRLMQLYGASIAANSDLDKSYISLSTLLPSLDKSLELYADIVMNPAFSQEEFERIKDQQINTIKRNLKGQMYRIGSLLPQILYGAGHPYAAPMDGNGTVESVSSIQRKDVVAHYSKWVMPNNATLIVVADIDAKILKSALNKSLGKWKKGTLPKKELPTAKTSEFGVLYIMDKPEAPQSTIVAAHLIDPFGTFNETHKEMANTVYGGAFTSRLNMNLREDKHWSYGARANVKNAVGQGLMLSFAPVQTDKTAESVSEMMKELNWIVGDKPITQEELDKVSKNAVLKLPGKWETNSAIIGSATEIVKYGLAENYVDQHIDNLRNITLKDVNKAAKQLIQPDKVNWFIVGDKDVIIDGLEKIGFSKIVILDENGNPVAE